MWQAGLSLVLLADAVVATPLPLAPNATDMPSAPAANGAPWDAPVAPVAEAFCNQVNCVNYCIEHGGSGGWCTPTGVCVCTAVP